MRMNIYVPYMCACADPQNAQLEAKCKYLFTQFDRDKDGYLNCAEMNKFTQTVNISHQKIDDMGWIKLCRYWVSVRASEEVLV